MLRLLYIFIFTYRYKNIFKIYELSCFSTKTTELENGNKFLSRNLKLMQQYLAWNPPSRRLLSSTQFRPMFAFHTKYIETLHILCIWINFLKLIQKHICVGRLPRVIVIIYYYCLYDEFLIIGLCMFIMLAYLISVVSLPFFVC